MSFGLYSHTTRATGTILTAAIYNSDHQNHITNFNPLMQGALSDNLTEHQLVLDPGGLGTEVLAANMAEELEQLRFAIRRITGKAQWYIAPATDLESVGGTIQDLVVAQTVAFQGDLTPAQITANQNNYAPTGHADAFRLRLSSDATRDITGLAGGAAGRMIVLTNVGVQNINLLNENGASSAGNRFNLPHGGNMHLYSGQSIILQYDNASSRWRASNFVSPTNIIIPGAITMLGNLGTVINLTQTGFTDVAEIAAPANPAANNVRLYAKDVGGVSKYAYRDSAGLETVLESASAARAYGEYTGTSTTSSVIPLDNSIPQSGEGIQIISVSLPALKSASSRVRFIFSGIAAGIAASSASSQILAVAALFKDSDANALHAVTTLVGLGGSYDGTSELSFVFEFAPGSAAAADYKVRVGVNSASDSIRFNGNAGGGVFSSAVHTSLVVEEIPV